MVPLLTQPTHENISREVGVRLVCCATGLNGAVKPLRRLLPTLPDNSPRRRASAPWEKVAVPLMAMGFSVGNRLSAGHGAVGVVEIGPEVDIARDGSDAARSCGIAQVPMLAPEVASGGCEFGAVGSANVDGVGSECRRFRVSRSESRPGSGHRSGRAHNYERTRGRRRRLARRPHPRWSHRLRLLRVARRGQNDSSWRAQIRFW